MPRIGHLTPFEQAKADEIRRDYGVSMLTRRQVGQVIGLKDTATGRWVKDVPYSIINNIPKYSVTDVARKIVSSRVEP